MISNSDFEKAWFLYKTEYEPQNVSINDFCIRKGLPYTEFNKWFRKTHKRVVPLEVGRIPVSLDGIFAKKIEKKKDYSLLSHKSITFVPKIIFES